MWVDQRGSEIVSPAECLRLLATAAKEGLVGRLAISQDQAPIVQPVNFAYRDRQVVVRIGAGTMASAVTGALVAFEVDHMDHSAGEAWSVLVRGLAAPIEEAEQLGALYVAPVPLVPSPGDHVLAIRTDVISGRRFSLREHI